MDTSSKGKAVSKVSEPPPAIEMDISDMLGGCCVCSDEEGWTDNSLVYCDGEGCSVAVHQACYGILRVPEGDWYCRRCEAIRNGQFTPNDIYCELCQRKDGALKPTENEKWCHVLCALYIPEATFGDVQAMEPIDLKNVQREKFGRTCAICDKNNGACTQCSCAPSTNTSSHGRNSTSCTVSFHVTCAQLRGLLYELVIGGTTRYPAYCEDHIKTLKAGLKIKRLPPYKGPPTAANSLSEKPPSGPPSLRSRKGTTSHSGNSNGGMSPPSSNEPGAEQTRTTRSGSVSSPNGQPSAEGKSSHKKEVSSEKHKKASKIHVKRRSELLNGQSPTGDSTSGTKGSEVEKKVRGRYKMAKKHSNVSEATEEATSEKPNGVVYYGKLSAEAAIRVGHSSTKVSTLSKNIPSSNRVPSGEARSSNVDLWSPFIEKRGLAEKSGASSSSSKESTSQVNSLEELLEDTFWKETGRFLLKELQQFAPSNIVELLHALYQVELENQKLEAKITSASSDIDNQRLTAARLAIPLSSGLPNFQAITTSQSSCSATSAANMSSISSSSTATSSHPLQQQVPTPQMPFPPNAMNGVASLAPFGNAKVPPTSLPSQTKPQLPPILSPPYMLPGNPGDPGVAAMQQMQMQQLYQFYQLQHHMHPPSSVAGHGSMLGQQPKMDGTSTFPNALPMVGQQAPPAGNVLSSLSALSTQQQSQQQRSLPLKLVEPAPTTVVPGNVLSGGSSASNLPPETLLVPPPPPLLTVQTGPATSLSSPALPSALASGGQKTAGKMVSHGAGSGGDQIKASEASSS